jgi:hypothetical protein
MTDLIVKAQEIDRLGQLAMDSANNAVDYALQAGQLLIDVKNSLKHGEFLVWIENNLSFNVRQAQRYMEVASGKKVPIRLLTGKYDKVSHLDKPVHSEGEWKNGQWLPEIGGSYVFQDDTGSYFVDMNKSMNQFHISKHYNGEKLSTKGAYWRYTIFAEITDPDFTSQYYIGTRHPLTNRCGVEGVLKSYGLKDVKKSLVVGYVSKTGLSRPHGEPDTKDWYWDGEHPEGELVDFLVRGGYVNSNGAITAC